MFRCCEHGVRFALKMAEGVSCQPAYGGHADGIPESHHRLALADLDWERVWNTLKPCVFPGCHAPDSDVAVCGHNQELDAAASHRGSKASCYAV